MLCNQLYTSYRCYDNREIQDTNENMSISRQSSPQRDFSAALSIKNETKEKFDAILKAAIHKNKKKSKSKEKLLSDSTTASSENLVDDVEDSDYILNKFYNNLGESDDIPPVPKPRTKKDKNNKTRSNDGTFIVVSSDTISNRTYKVEETVQVLVHSPNKTADGSPISGISPLLLSPASKFSNEKKIVGQDIELKEIISKRDSIEYEEEVRPRPKPRKRQQIDTKEEINSTKTRYKYDKIVEIIVHKTDKLLLNSLVIHPIVKIHIVNVQTGLYLKKSDKNRNVMFFYENKDCSHVVPVMTHSYNLQKERSLFPIWEEPIVLNEDYEYFKEQAADKMIIFFEILDFVTFSVASNTQSNKSGWHKIAFAFLKPIVKNGDNLARKIRLQLYYPPHGFKAEEVGKCDIWQYWTRKKMQKYPSSLYITIKPVISPGKVVDVLRSQNPHENEFSQRRLNLNGIVEPTEDDNENNKPQKSVCDSKQEEEISNETWGRKPYETCRLPNKLWRKLDDFQDGCFVSKFSNKGLFLACAGKIDKYFGIIIYSVKTWESTKTFSCHQALIYSIAWSKDDSLIILASSDNTVSIWNLEKSTFFQVLPHPAFVYCAKISSNNNEIASGGYDRTLRIWIKDKNKYKLNQELDCHKGFITCICFNENANLILSSDSTGNIIEWIKNKNDWTLNRKITLLDLREVVINQIVLFGKEKKLLINSRDSILRIVDLKSTCILHWLTDGDSNKRMHSFCCISPCETFMFCGNNNGYVNVWKAKTAHLQAKYEAYGDLDLTINCVEYHPFDNILVVSHYGSNNLPVLIYCFTKTQENENVLQILNVESQSDQKRISDFRATHSWTVQKQKNKIDIRSVLQKMDEVIVAQQPIIQ